MTFDQYGYLVPYEVIPADFDTFETVFVKNFSNTSKRHQWFKNYVAYVGELKTLLGTGFTQWIDGSFISQKFNPNDNVGYLILLWICITNALKGLFNLIFNQWKTLMSYNLLMSNEQRQ